MNKNINQLFEFLNVPAEDAMGIADKDDVVRLLYKTGIQAKEVEGGHLKLADNIIVPMLSQYEGWGDSRVPTEKGYHFYDLGYQLLKLLTGKTSEAFLPSRYCAKWDEEEMDDEYGDIIYAEDYFDDEDCWAAYPKLISTIKKISCFQEAVNHD